MTNDKQGNRRKGNRRKAPAMYQSNAKSVFVRSNQKPKETVDDSSPWESPIINNYSFVYIVYKIGTYDIYRFCDTF
jgi:hypothetical protein